MYPAIDNPASCEIRAVICSLHAKSMSAAGIHSEICAVYDQNVMSDGMFKDGRTNIHDKERSGRLAICSE
jgi:hypothetical protein